MEEKKWICISGVTEAVVYRNDANGYAVLKVATESDETIIATGCLPEIAPGELITLYGEWTVHPAYGEQFSVDSFERMLPESEEGMQAYLASGVIRGVGRKLAEKIVKRFGTETFAVLDREPHRLTEIRGITEKKAENIHQQFLRHTEIRYLIDYLTEHKLPISLSARIYSRFGSNSVEMLENNPYLLCEPEFDVDFALVDEVAEELGFSMRSEERLCAGILYVLKFNLQNGHTFIPERKLLAAAHNLLQREDVELGNTVEEAFQHLLAEDRLIREAICGEDAVYLKNLFGAEQYLADYLQKLSQREYHFDFDIDELIEELEKDNELSYAPLQRQAIRLAATHGVAILTGGPGTGKTTTVKGIIEVMEAMGLEVVLAAPTGRAAKRLSDLCGREAKTIHRLLEAGYAPGEKSLVFKRNASNPLDGDVIIIDEVSMVDILVMQSLFQALRPDTRIILVGDADQLPPVGPGNFLRDLAGSGRIPIITLNEIFRQASQSAIVLNAHRVNHGEMPTAAGKDGDFFIIHCREKDRQRAVDKISKTVVELSQTRLSSYYGLTSSQIQVLSPARKQGAGTMRLNQMLQEALNPPEPDKPEKRFGDTIFRKGDRVMQVRNNYDIMWYKGEEVGTGLFNGDVGEILEVSLEGQSLTINFDDRIAEYSFDALSELELAYAMTVHKAQGSEFDAVVMAVSPGMSKRLLSRNILYTAITRAKKLMVLVGPDEIIAYMVQNNTKNKRYSALRARLHDQKDEANDEE
jgi:exodeoxyribonuclease V alpha subunit